MRDSARGPSEASNPFCYDLLEGWGSGLVLADTAGVAVDSQDQVYVLNRSREHPIVVLNPDGGFVRSWGQGLFRRAHALFIGPNDLVYAIDDQGHALRKFTPDGRLLMEITTADRPTDTGYVPGILDSVKRSGPPFNTPTGVAVAPNGDILVSDGYGNARIHRFSEKGKLLHSFGEPGRSSGQFFLPHGLAVDRDGTLYVADRENSRVQVFAPDGAYLREWRSPRASSLLITAEGLVFTTEMGEVIQGPPGQKHLEKERAHPGISIRDKTGELLGRLLPHDPDGEGLFFAPHSIAMDSKGNLFVSEVSDSYSGGLAPKERPRLHKYTSRGSP